MSEQKVKSYEDLKVWQKAHEITLSIYKITQKFPSDEKFGLISQARRCSSSIAANIVEGHARSSRKDFAHFLTIARGSLEELKYFIRLSKDLDFVAMEDFQRLNQQCDELGRMLYVFRQKLNA